MSDARAVRREAGFALLVLLAVIGVGSVGLLLAVQGLLPTLAERAATCVDRVQTAATAARRAHRRDGAFPGDLDALALRAGLQSDGAWRIDPYGSAQELDYRLLATGVSVRSRGADRQLGTADDVRLDVDAETQLRVRQRLRLRLLRSVLLRSQYRLAGTMTAGDELQMRTAMGELARARRRWLTADAATRATLTSEMAAATATIDGLVTLHSLPALPATMTGAGGLMSQLGMSDLRAVDGAGVALQLDAGLGWRAVGADGAGGTDDDM